MDDIFSINAEYSKSLDGEYTRKHLIEILELSKGSDSAGEAEYKAAKKYCEELCPMTLGKKSSIGMEGSSWLDAKQRDDSVKFLHSEIKSIRAEEQAGMPYPGGPEERSKNLEYLERLIKELSEDEPNKLLGKDRERSFEYLQFLYYMIVINRLCNQKGLSAFTGPKTPSEQYRIMVKENYKRKQNEFSFFSCLKNPSERYLPVYNKVIGEIRRKISTKAYVIEGGPNDFQIESEQAAKGRYDDSIHALQQFVDLISQTLIYAYNFGDDALKTLKDREQLFRTKIEPLMKERPNGKSYYPAVQVESWWDELYFRLNYYRCMYWELDMLWAYRKVNEIAHKPLPQEHKLFTMREEKGRKAVFENDCYLILDSETGKLSEKQKISFSDASASPDIELFTKALRLYIEDRIQEIVQKTFRVPKADRLQEKRILNNIGPICEYFKMELQRYGRNCILAKSKLISAYQVFFMSQPKEKIAPTMEGTIKAQTPSGLQRSKNTVSSCYSNSSEKDPRCLQLVCTWTDYQYIWNTQGSFFAQKFLETSILALKAITVVDYRCGMPDVQAHAEKVLFTAIETLIPDEDGKEQLENCISTLKRLEYQVIADFTKSSLLTFGKFYKLFSDRIIISLIVENFKYLISESKTSGPICLELATDNAFRVHSPILWVRYNKTNNTFVLLNFANMNWRSMCS